MFKFIRSFSMLCFAAPWWGCGTGDPQPGPEVPQREVLCAESVHGGCLNVIGDDLAHAEVKVEDGVFRCWFVDGGSHTDMALRLGADAIELEVTLPGGEKKTLKLGAKPLELADETPGHCSYFEARADWLRTAKKFSALGEVHLKGNTWKLRIDYPEGYDPLAK